MELSSWNPFPFDKTNPVPVLLRHIRSYSAVNAFFDLDKTEVPFICNGIQTFNSKHVFCSFCDDAKLAIVSWSVRYVIVDNQMVLIIDCYLAVVARFNSASVLHQPAVRVNHG